MWQLSGGEAIGNPMKSCTEVVPHRNLCFLSISEIWLPKESSRRSAAQLTIWTRILKFRSQCKKILASVKSSVTSFHSSLPMLYQSFQIVPLNSQCIFLIWSWALADAIAACNSFFPFFIFGFPTFSDAQLKTFRISLRSKYYKMHIHI